MSFAPRSGDPLFKVMDSERTKYEERMKAAEEVLSRGINLSASIYEDMMNTVATTTPPRRSPHANALTPRPPRRSSLDPLVMPTSITAIRQEVNAMGTRLIDIERAVSTTSSQISALKDSMPTRTEVDMIAEQRLKAPISFIEEKVRELIEEMGGLTVRIEEVEEDLYGA